MNLVPPSVWGIMTIIAEARGEPYEGKVAVGEVIRERTKRCYSSDGTIPGTVLWPKQFSCWNSGDRNRIYVANLDTTSLIVKQCIEAWEDSINGDFTKGAVLYCNRNIVQPVWASDNNFLVRIGDHWFYSDNGND
jgi:N-acetylmuramoyl-L-alanine amidase